MWVWIQGGAGSLLPNQAAKALASPVLPSCHFTTPLQSQWNAGSWVLVLAGVQGTTSQLSAGPTLNANGTLNSLPASLVSSLKKENTVQQVVVPADKDVPTGSSVLRPVTGPASAWRFVPPFSPPELGYFIFFLPSLMRSMYFISAK